MNELKEKSYLQMKTENEWCPENEGRFSDEDEDYFTTGKPDECTLDSELSDPEGGLYVFLAPDRHWFGVFVHESKIEFIDEKGLFQFPDLRRGTAMVRKQREMRGIPPFGESKH